MPDKDPFAAEDCADFVVQESLGLVPETRWRSGLAFEI